MSVSGPTSYAVQAYNLSHASENRIHDDAVAKSLGFAGGLVPGVEVYGYMTHLAMAAWGRAWLERGEMTARFLKPVYDGHIATVTAHPTDDGLALELASDGVLCATGMATSGDTRVEAPPADNYPEQPLPVGERPPADEASLAPGKLLCVAPIELTETLAAGYLGNVRESHPIYAAEGLAHPGWLLRLCNSALKENVALPPWIHTGSRVRNFRAGRVGDTFEARARVQANYERKGHRLVDLDAIILANGTTVVARVLHTAVYRLRQAEAR